MMNLRQSPCFAIVFCLGIGILFTGCQSEDATLGETVTAGAKSSASSAPLPVLISADMAAGLFTLPPNYSLPFPSDIDDGIAIALAINAAEADGVDFRPLDVKGISITFGNNERDAELAQTRELVHEVMGRRDISVEGGATGPLPEPGPDGEVDPCITPGVQMMAEQLEKGPATLLALGPLTDLACLARAYPAQATNISHVLAQIGARPHEEYTLPGPEYDLRASFDCCLWSVNVSLDVPAVEYVLTASELAGARWTIAPWHFVAQTLLDTGRLARLGGDRPEGQWLRQNSVAFQAFWLAAFHEAGIHPWDVTLVHYLMRPDDMHTAAVDWRIVDCTDPEDPAGRPTNSDCAGHSPMQLPLRDAEPAQLWLGEGESQIPHPRLFILDDYASDSAYTRFLDTAAALSP